MFIDFDGNIVFKREQIETWLQEESEEIKSRPAKESVIEKREAEL